MSGYNKPLSHADAERFWSKVAKTDTCWIWSKVKLNGYGYISLQGKEYCAHRVSYEMSKGEIPRGVEIDHTCHNRACINPDHLRTATKKQNAENLPTLNPRNKSGARGVSFCKMTRKWVARVGHKGKPHIAGYFENVKDAEAAAIALRNRLFTHNNLDRGPAMNVRTTTRPIALPAPVDPNYRAPYLSRQDADTMYRAGLTLTEWQKLTDQQRADLRWRMGA